MADRNTMPRSERYRVARRRLIGAARIVLQDAADAQTGGELHELTSLAWQIVQRRNRVSFYYIAACHDERGYNATGGE